MYYPLMIQLNSCKNNPWRIVDNKALTKGHKSLNHVDTTAAKFGNFRISDLRILFHKIQQTETKED